jgi:hypothetical protein
MASKTVQVMFDGEMHECLVQTADNGEIICWRKDRQFIKFPPDADLKAALKEHNKHNGEVPVLAEEADAKKAELEAWFEEK